MRIILDTDLAMGVPGSDVDDGFALALLLAEEVFDLELVTTVNGNIDVESAAYLSMDLLRLLGHPHVPVVRGAAAPMIEPEKARVAPQQMREQLGHHRVAPGFAAAEIARRVLDSPSEITIVAIGPLTNVALAIAMETGVAQAVKEIVVMGGVFLTHTHVRQTPGEFNWWTDPHAARTVIRSGAPIRLVGLDVTHQVLLTRRHAATMAAGGSPFGAFASDCTNAVLDRLDRDRPDRVAGGQSFPLHDPLAVVAVSRPELLTWRDARVEVLTAEAEGRGVVVTDLLSRPDAPAPNARIATEVQTEAVMEYFLERIAVC